VVDLNSLVGGATVVVDLDLGGQPLESGQGWVAWGGWGVQERDRRVDVAGLAGWGGAVEFGLYGQSK